MPFPSFPRLSDRVLDLFFSPEGILIGSVWASAALLVLILLIFAIPDPAPRGRRAGK